MNLSPIINIYFQRIFMKKTNTYMSNKLWRDKAVDMLETKHGSIIVWEYLNDADFNTQLRAKLEEEAQEVAKTQSIPELIEEIADVYEVIDTLLALHKIDKADI